MICGVRVLRSITCCADGRAGRWAGGRAGERSGGRAPTRTLKKKQARGRGVGGNDKFWEPTRGPTWGTYDENSRLQGWGGSIYHFRIWTSTYQLGKVI